MNTVYEKKDGHHVIGVSDYKFSFIECLGMAVTCEKFSLHDEPGILLRPDVVINVVDMLARCIACKNMVFPRKLVFTCPATLFDVINSMLCIARVKAQRLKYLCLSFTIDKAKNYRYRHGVARRIQRAWKRAISDPSYALCRKRLLREFHDITPCPDTTS